MLWATQRFFACFQLISVTLFTLLFSARTINLALHRGINPIALRLKSKGPAGLYEVGYFVWVNLWIFTVLAASLPFGERLAWLSHPRLLDAPIIRPVGALLITIGFVFFILGLVALGDSWRLGIDDKNPGRLVTHGVYSISRNPIYLFFALYFAGIFLINGTLIFLFFAVTTIAWLHHQALREERFLTRIHGPAYEAYRAKISRYFGWRQAIEACHLGQRREKAALQAAHSDPDPFAE